MVSAGVMAPSVSLSLLCIIKNVRRCKHVSLPEDFTPIELSDTVRKITTDHIYMSFDNLTNLEKLKLYNTTMAPEVMKFFSILLNTCFL